MGKVDTIQKVLARFTPDERAFAEAVTLDRAQNKIFAQQLNEMKSAYDELWKVVIVMLHAHPRHELRIHESQFLRFKHEYRIDRTFDKETKEVVLRLLTVHDDLPESE